MFFSYPDWTVTLTINTDASDKHLGAVISPNIKTIALLWIILSKIQCNYTTTEKDILVIVEFLEKLQVILFGYEINVFSYHKNMVYAATLSEFQRVMHWQFILKEFGPNIQHIYGVDKIVPDALQRLPSTSVNKYEPRTSKAQCRTKNIFSIGRKDNNEDCFELNLLNMQG